MSMRARVVLIGLMALGQGGAQATAPQIVDPHEDLFEPTLKSAVPSETMPSSKPESNHAAGQQPAAAAKPNPEKAPAAARAERELPANPLWAIPLSQLSAMRDRPPFSPSRRPPQPVAVAKPAQPATPPPKFPDPVTTQLSLVGTIVGAGSSVGLFINAADKSTIRLKLGDKHNGWVLRTVASRQVELANGLDSAVLRLPAPDMKPVSGPLPPPYPVGAPQAMPAPQGTPMRGAPGTAAQTTNAPGAQGPAKLVIQPPVFEPPQAAANPFRSPVAEKGVKR